MTSTPPDDFEAFTAAILEAFRPLADALQHLADQIAAASTPPGSPDNPYVKAR